LYAISPKIKKIVVKQAIMPVKIFTILVVFIFLISLRNFGLTYLWNIYYGHKIYGIFGSLHEFVKIYMQIPLISYIEKKNKVKIYTYGFFF
jgi:hypothetical protein